MVALDCSCTSRNIKHGHTALVEISPEYFSWANMKGRYVDDPAVELWANYAGRGIRVWERCTGETKGVNKSLMGGALGSRERAESGLPTENDAVSVIFLCVDCLTLRA
jgi:hypothetical protein